jgi:hypothetical protein
LRLREPKGRRPGCGAKTSAAGADLAVLRGARQRRGSTRRILRPARLRQALALSFATPKANAGLAPGLGYGRSAGQARHRSRLAFPTRQRGGAVEYRGGTFRGLGVNVRSQRSTTSKESLTRKGRCRAVAAGVYPRYPQLCAGGGRRRPSRGRPTRTQVENGAC